MSLFTHYQSFINVCSDEWIADTYAEYLESATANVSKVIQAVQEALVFESSDIDNIIDGCYDSVEQMRGYLVQDYNQHLPTAGTPIGGWCTDNESFFNFVKTNYYANEDLTYGYQDWQNLKGFTGSFDQYKQIILGETIDPSLFGSFEGHIDIALSSILSSYNLEGQQLMILPSGTTTISNIVDKALRNSYSALDPYEDEYSTIKDLINQTIANKPTFGEVIDQIKETFASNIALTAGFKAMKEPNIGNRIQIMNDYITRNLGDAYTKVSGAIDQIKSVVADTATNITSFMLNMKTLLGFDKIADEQITNVDQTDFALYTGVAPTGAICFDTAKHALQSTGKIIVTAVKALWDGLMAISERAIKWCYDKVDNALVNPYDVVKLDNDSTSGLIDGFCYFENSTHFDYQYVQDWSSSEVNKIINSARGHFGNWISYKTIFGELLINITDIQNESEHPDTLTVYLSWRFKPKPISSRYLWSQMYQFVEDPTDEFIPRCGLLNELNIDDYADWLKNFRDGGLIYESTDSSEEDLFLGYITSIMMMSQVMSRATFDLTLNCDTRWQIAFPDLYDPYLMYTDISAGKFGTTSGNITNADFIKAACGYNKSGDDTFCNKVPTGVFVSSIYAMTQLGQTGQLTAVQYVQGIPYLFTYALLASFFDRSYYPTDYFFLPYSNNVTDFSEPQYRIKTDAENQEIANFVVNAVVIIAVIIIGIVVCKTAINTIRRAKVRKWHTFMGQLDNAVWNGKGITDASGNKISLKSYKKYERYAKKLAKVNWLGEGITTAAATSSISSLISNPSNNSTTNAEICSKLAKLISGSDS